LRRAAPTRRIIGKKCKKGKNDAKCSVLRVPKIFTHIIISVSGKIYFAA